MSILCQADNRVGLFSLYCAQVLAAVRFRGLDLSPRRVRLAAEAAKRLRLSNITYEVGNLRDYRVGGVYEAAYMFDIVHHIPRKRWRGSRRGRTRAATPAGAISGGIAIRGRPIDVGSPMPSISWSAWAG